MTDAGTRTLTEHTITCMHGHDALVDKHISCHAQVCSHQRTHTGSHVHTHVHTPIRTLSTAALANVPLLGLGINNPLWGFYTFTFLFLTRFKVLFRVRSEDEGLRVGGRGAENGKTGDLENSCHF